jgi:hypothetical protein
VPYLDSGLNLVGKIYEVKDLLTFVGS